MKQVTIYTDGSALGNPGKGGWAALLIYGEKRKELSGAAELATNNQMELTAALKALEALKQPCQIELYTDSQYLRKGITEWIHNWLKNNWRSSNKKPVKNQELWQALYSATQKHQIKWHWVKAHNGDEFNELVDDLARKRAEEI